MFCFRVVAAVDFAQQACSRGNRVIRHQEEQIETRFNQQ